MPLVYPGSDAIKLNPDSLPGSQPLVRPSPLVKADHIAYLIWDLPDLAKQQAFLQDFGMLTALQDDNQLYMRGYGSQPYLYVARKAAKAAFAGTGFAVRSRAELETLAAATGSFIVPLSRPGGGEMVALTDPMGNRVEVVYGIAETQPVDTRRQPLPTNYINLTQRLNCGQRPALEPAAILRPGHCVLGTHNLQQAAAWYMRHLGLIPSDVACIEDGSPALAFLRLDRGREPADHHSLVLAQGAGERYLHSAFEVYDLDSLAQGQQYLKARHSGHLWGIGRHILGSQLFDYWRDPSGFEIEHYADGDVFTADHPTDYHPLDSGNIYAWGHDIPKAMTSPTAAQLLGVLVAACRGKISLRWLAMAKRGLSRPARPWL